MELSSTTFKTNISFVTEPSIYVGDSVDKDFLQNTVKECQYLFNNSKGVKVKNIVIASSTDDYKNLGLDDKTYKALTEGTKVPYGMYSEEYDTIFITEKSHNRKDENYEGEIETQGADTLSHEFAHLLDKGVSGSSSFIEAYLQDLSDLSENLAKNPDEKIADSTMTYKEAVEYFNHYMEGVNFEDGIDEHDVTKTGLRENFAESFSNIFDLNPSSINSIYSSIFKNSTECVKEIFVA